MTRKKTVEEICIAIKEMYGYELISKEYLGNKEPIIVSCGKCGEFETTFNYLIRGRGLCECYKKRVQKHDIGSIRLEFEKEGYLLLSDKYEDNKKPLWFICNNGHKTTTTYAQFKKGQRCGQCFGNIKKDIEFVRQYFKDRGCVLISREYEDEHSPLVFMCDCGSKAITTWNKFQRGCKCNNCRYQRASQSLYKNGTVPCSKGQYLIHSITGGEINYPISHYNVDVALLDKKIFLEFDGFGHDFQVKKGQMSREGFENREKARHKNIAKEGWKEIRILCYENRAPSKEILSKTIHLAIQYLSVNEDSKFIIDLDNGLLVYGGGKFIIDLGRRKHITHRML
jgi:very-short-patch-repair endonuclease